MFCYHRITRRIIALFFMSVIYLSGCNAPADDSDTHRLAEYAPAVEIGGRTTVHEINESDVENTSFSLSSAHYIYPYIDTAEFKNNIRHLCDDPDSYLNGEDGCYISVVPIRRFFADYGTETPAVMYFVFTKDMEAAGEIGLIESNGSMMYNGSYYLRSLDRRSSLLDFMISDPDRYYIPLADYNNLVLLDEDNTIVYGTNKQNFSINGDVYGVLKEFGFGVSYNQITSYDSCIWYEF